MIPAKYQKLGFYITRFGAHSLALKRHHRAIFIFSSDKEISEGLIRELCECNLRVFGLKEGLGNLATVTR